LRESERIQPSDKCHQTNNYIITLEPELGLGNPNFGYIPY